MSQRLSDLTRAELEFEHGAMSSCLSMVEGVDPALYGRLQRHYMDCVLASRGEARRRCPKGGYHAWPRNPSRDGRECLKCGQVPS